jgi:hypothetical protein
MKSVPPERDDFNLVHAPSAAPTEGRPFPVNKGCYNTPSETSRTGQNWTGQQGRTWGVGRSDALAAEAHPSAAASATGAGRPAREASASPTYNRPTGSGPTKIKRTPALAAHLMLRGLEAGLSTPRNFHAFRAGERLSTCQEQYPDGGKAPRCGAPHCPYCQYRVAKKNRLELERIFRQVETDKGRLAFLTVTVGTDSLSEGYLILTKGLSWLHGLAAWTKRVQGGSQYVELKPCQEGKRRRWLAHAHCALELRPGTDLNALRADLIAAWQRFLGGAFPGRVHLVHANPGWDRFRERSARGHWYYRKGSKLAFYVTKRKRSELRTYTPDQLEEALKVMPGKRLTTRLGSWRGQ